MELIQYAPTTAEVYRRPLLIVPPWINKFYVLDLNPAKSFVRWAVDQGLTVFVISWVNPDERHADKDFESYMREGIFAALDAIEAATGEREVTAIGYCVGGTLLAVTLAYMAPTGRPADLVSATFFTAQTDFRNAGDLKVFADEEQIAAVEAEMSEQGYLAGLEDGQCLQHAAPERPDLDLRRQQLPEGQVADGLRPADLEFRLHPDAGRQPLLLPAQLLSREQADAGRDGHRRRDARSRPR